MSIAVVHPCQKSAVASFEDAWLRLSLLLEDPQAFAIQFVFSGNYTRHSALLQRLQQTAHSRGIDCLELPETTLAALADVSPPAQPGSAQQLAEAVTRHCLARIFPLIPQRRLLLLDLHQALPAAITALMPEPAATDSATQAIVQQASADSRALLLSRLNERRAQLAELGPLLILLPEDWTKAAAQYAPDLWTLRLSSLYLASLPVSADEEVAVPERHANLPQTPSSPRAAERKILERWQAALSTGQTRRLPIADGWIAARTSAQLGNGQEAEQIAQLCLQMAYERGSRREQMISQGTLGDMRLRRGLLEQAREAYTVALALAQKQVEAEPDNSEWQRDLSVSYDNVANILLRSDPQAALANYQASLKIAQTLVAREPDNSQWQRDLSISYNQIADILLRSNPQAALANYQAGLRIAQSLAAREPDNSEWQRDLSVSYEKVADILQRSDPQAALAHYLTSLRIAQTLAGREPDNSEWQRDLSVSYNKVADILLRSDPPAALAHYQASLKIRQSLAGREPDNSEWQRDLSVSYIKVADILQRSDPPAALANYQASLKIHQTLTGREPDNGQWQRDLSVSYERVADILRRSDPAAALAHYQASLKIRQTLAGREPDNSEWQCDLSVSYNKVADILQRSDPPAALANYQTSLKIRQTLASRELDNSQWQRDLSVSYIKVADILLHSDPQAALANYQASLKIHQTLAAREPDNIEGQTDLIVSQVKLASLYPATLDVGQARSALQTALNIAQALLDAGQLDSEQQAWPDDLRQKLAALPAP